MKIKINTKKLQALNPCRDRLNNWLKYYSDFNEDIIEFLDLPNITSQDKIWVTLKLVSKEILEIFTLDCAFSAEKYKTYDIVYAYTYTSPACNAYTSDY